MSKKEKIHFAAIRFYSDEKKTVYSVPTDDIKNFRFEDEYLRKPYFVKRTDPITGEEYPCAAQILAIASNEEDLRTNRKRFIFHKRRESDVLKELADEERGIHKHKKDAQKDFKRKIKTHETEELSKIMQENMESRRAENKEEKLTETNDKEENVVQELETLKEKYKDMKKMYFQTKNELQEVILRKDHAFEELQLEFTKAKEKIESLTVINMKLQLQADDCTKFKTTSCPVNRQLFATTPQSHFSRVDTSPILTKSKRRRLNPKQTLPTTPLENYIDESLEINFEESDEKTQNEENIEKNYMNAYGNDLYTNQQSDKVIEKRSDKHEMVCNRGYEKSIDEEIYKEIKKSNINIKQEPFKRYKKEVQLSNKKQNSDDEYLSDNFVIEDNKKNYTKWTKEINGKCVRMKHLRLGISISYEAWKDLNTKKPSLYLRKLAKAIWGTHNLMNRAIQLDKSKARIPGRSPRKPLTPIKKAALRKVFHDFLNETIKISIEKKKEKKQWRNYLRIYINSLIQTEQKMIEEKAKNQNKPSAESANESAENEN